MLSNEKLLHMKKSVKLCHLRQYRSFLRFVKPTSDKTSKSLFRLLQLATYTAVTVFSINVISLFFENEQNFGTFGDFFGGVLNPILTFLTFMGLLITIILQQTELSLTRKELANSSKSLYDQSVTLEKQRFEDTFFSLFSQHNDILRTITEKMVEHGLRERPVMNYIHGRCFQINIKDGNAISLKQANERLFKENHLIGHYFRILYQLLKLIATKSPASPSAGKFNHEILKEKPVTEEEKNYSNIVRSILNQEVLQLLVVNCYSDNQNDQFKKYRLLIERYQFFEHMTFYVGTNLHPVLLEAIDYYGKHSFGDNSYVKEISSHQD